MSKRERKNVELYTGKQESPRVIPPEEAVSVSPNDTAGIDDEKGNKDVTRGTVDGTPTVTPVSNDKSVKNGRNVKDGKTAKTDKNDKKDETKKGTKVEAPDDSGTKSPTFHVQIPEAVKPAILEIQLHRLVATGVKHTIADIITEAVNYYHKNLKKDI